MWLHPRLQKSTHLFATDESMKDQLQINFFDAVQSVLKCSKELLLSYVR